MTVIKDPASPHYEYDGTMSTSDLAAATIARLRRLQPELSVLAEQLGLLGLTGAATEVEMLTQPHLVAMITDRGTTTEEGTNF